MFVLWIYTQNSFSACEYPVSCLSTICWEVYSFPTTRSWHPCWKLVDDKCEFTSKLSVLFPGSMEAILVSLLHCSFGVGFEFRKSECSNFFKIILAILGLLHVPMNFRISLSFFFFYKKIWNFDTACIKFIKLGSIAILISMLTLPIHDYKMSFQSFSSFSLISTIF